MMKDGLKTLAIAIFLVPVVALFGGCGILAYQIGQSWESANTNTLIGSMATALGAFAVVVAITLGLVVGVPLALRAYSAAAAGHKRWDGWDEVPTQHRLPATRQRTLTAQPRGDSYDVPEGSWQSAGDFDLWEGDEDAWQID